MPKYGKRTCHLLNILKIDMFVIRNEIQFDMAHYLQDYNGKCANIHGHRYRLLVSVSSAELHKEGHLRGMVDDFSLIKKSLKGIEEQFDHKLLVEDCPRGREVASQLIADGFDVIMLPFRPTCEEMSRYIYYKLKDSGLNVSKVELYETPGNSCTFYE